MKATAASLTPVSKYITHKRYFMFQDIQEGRACVYVRARIHSNEDRVKRSSDALYDEGVIEFEKENV